jgi:predicted dehydrogenase
MKIGMIGTGNWGKNIAKNLYELQVLKSIAEPSVSARQTVESYLGVSGIEWYDSYEALLHTDIDGVAIATPVPTHFEIAQAALNAGKDVFLEKPMTLSVDEAQILVELAEKRKRILMIGHLLLYQPAIQKIKLYLDAGKLGTVHSLHQVRCNLGKARSVENALWSLGVHDIAVLLYLCSETPHRILVAGQSVLTAGVEDDVYVHMEFPSGKKAHLHNSWLWFDRERHLTIIGSKGMLVFNEITQQLTLHKKTISPELKKEDQGMEILFEGGAQPLRLELEHFLFCIESRTSPQSDGKSGLEVIRVMAQAEKQLRTGEPNHE